MKFSCPPAKRKREKGPGNWAMEIMELPREEQAEYFEKVPESMRLIVRYHVKRMIFQALPEEEQRERRRLCDYRLTF